MPSIASSFALDTGQFADKGRLKYLFSYDLYVRFNEADRVPMRGGRVCRQAVLSNSCSVL